MCKVKSRRTDYRTYYSIFLHTLAFVSSCPLTYNNSSIMIKPLLRNTAIYALSLYLLPAFISGVDIVGGVLTLFIAGIALSLLFIFVKPIFSVLTFPFNIMSMGIFSIITNALILYLLTVFVPNVSINAYKFSGVSLAGFSIEPIQINTIFAFIFAALALSAISGTIRWLMK